MLSEWRQKNRTEHGGVVAGILHVLRQEGLVDRHPPPARAKDLLELFDKNATQMPELIIVRS